MIRLDRSSPAHIQLLLAGFQPIVMHREKHFNAWFIGSVVLFYTIIPIIIDIATSNITRYDDTGIAVGMTPLPGHAPYPPQPPAPAYPPQPPQPQPQ